MTQSELDNVPMPQTVDLEPNWRGVRLYLRAMYREPARREEAKRINYDLNCESVEHHGGWQGIE